jgi:hypothetical protein
MAVDRTIADLGYDIVSDVLYAIDLLEGRYGAPAYRDSNHTTRRPVWVFKTSVLEAEVGMPMNKRDLTLYMRSRTLDGRRLTDLLPPTKVVKLYPRDGNPAQSIIDSPFLGPSKSNECVRLDLERADLEPLFEMFFAVKAPASLLKPSPTATASLPENPVEPIQRQPTDAQAFEALLERRSEIVQAGELLVLLDEIERLRSLGCPDPDKWVKQISDVDVGRGFDIESSWPGQERCIEVTTTTQAGNDFYLTENERRVLSSLSDKAWLYRVVLKPNGEGNVVARLQNPLGWLTVEALKPVVFRVEAGTLEHATVVRGRSLSAAGL